MSKEKKQVVILAVMLIGILGVIAYVYKDSLLPSTSGGAIPAGVRIEVPTISDKDPFFDRKDYQALRGTAGVPVQALKVETKGVDPFAPIK